MLDHRRGRSKKDMLRHGLLFLGAAVAALILLLTSAIDVVHGQNPPGFLSIDCGKKKGFTYNDSTTGLLFVSDFDFIDAGEIHKVSEESYSSPYNTEELFDLRSFPSGIRNCYNISSSVKRGWKYLLRTHFFYGNYDGRKDRLPVRFDLYVGTVFWETVVVTEPFVAQAHEIIFFSMSDALHVCLVDTGSGTPFISDIELRPLHENIYAEVASYRWLSLVRRYNIGAGNFMRYPFDPHDRFWWTFPEEGWQRDYVKTTNITQYQRYETPPYIMRSAAFPPVNGTSLNFTLADKFVSPHPPEARYHVLLHFAELYKLAPGEKREFRVLRGGEPVFDNISPRYFETTSSFFTTYVNHDLDYSIVQTNESTLPPLLNALEFYVVIDVSYHETEKDNVEAVTNIKALFELKKNWMGDPCLPRNFTWEGLKCDGSNTPRITSLNLSSSGLDGEIPSPIINLTKLEFLDLSNNSMTGKIPDFLANLQNLKLLNLSYNKLSGAIPKTLSEKSKSGILTLSTDGNPDLEPNPTSSTGVKSGTKLIVIVVVVVFITSMIVTGVLRIVLVVRRGQRHTADDENARKSNHIETTSMHSDTVQYTYNDLEKITKNFMTELGRGAFGTVYHGTLEGNVQVAVKLLSQSSTQVAKDQFMNEAMLLMRIHHRNLVSLLGYCNELDHLALIYECKEEGNLKDHLSGKSRNGDALGWSVRLRIAIEVAQGLEYLHYSCKPAIVHRDVKSSNILLNKNWEASIADFGLSKIFQNDDFSYMLASVAGTPGYLDPEYSITRQLNERSDVYSFGIVLLELVTGRSVTVMELEDTNLVLWVLDKFQNGDIVDIIDDRLRDDYDANLARRTLEIAMACTAGQSRRRPTMSEVVALLKDCSKGTAMNVISNQDIGSTTAKETGYKRSASIKVLVESQTTIQIKDASSSMRA